MALYWRDLLAWQQILESDVSTPAGGGLVQLCQQDPNRVYLCISCLEIRNGSLCITTQPSPSGPISGIPLTSAIEGSNGAVSIDLNALNLSWQLALDQIAFAYNSGTGNGTVGPTNPALEGSVAMSGMDQVQFLMTFPGLFAQKAESVREFEVARHGALAQAAWYAYEADLVGNRNVHVLAVRQESGPCDTGPLRSVMATAKPQTVSWLDSMTREDTSNGVSQGSTAKSVQSVFRPNWDGISPDSGAE